MLARKYVDLRERHILFNAPILTLWFLGYLLENIIVLKIARRQEMAILPAVAFHRNLSPQQQQQSANNAYDIPNQDIYINDDFDDDFDGANEGNQKRCVYETLYESL